ncbi:hypothetical protein [Mycobacterium sp. OTB74]|jgi:hypothetical protein|uniref:hypothetical protein n=1 Tax=Mycobacterium sp. OTB74 TaxID=1853452 RepID=UPI002473B07F|nr:hypothetical protein [Mycobacterium sp. OTB74]MDH6247419.1 hypothetical protein [Mycobacterium sp. OTB74]
MTKRSRYQAAVLVMSVAAAGAIWIPVAGAGVRPTCEDEGTYAVCETNGSVSVKAVPEARGSGNPDPSQRVGSQGRRSCYLEQPDRAHICQ